MRFQALSTLKQKLELAGVVASVESLARLQDDEDLPSPAVVAVVTRKPYEAWRVLTGQRDLHMEERPPTSIAERIDGVDVVIGTEQAFASFSARAS